MTKYDVGVLSRGDQVLASGRLGKIASVHEPKWVDHKTKRHMHEFHGADVTFNDGGATYFHAKDLNVFGTTTTNRPPSCDLPPEFYDVLKHVKPCPMCENDQVGFEILTGIFIEEYKDDEVAVKCDRCGFEYNDLKHRKSKGAAVKAWNSLVRRFEVLELLWRVQNVLDNPSPTELGHLGEYADKIRKEMRD